MKTSKQHLNAINENAIKSLSNNKIFSKSYFGKLKQKQMNTPENKISPEDDKEKITCITCNGKGSVITWNKDEDDNEEPEQEECNVCEGSGEVEDDRIDF